MVWGIIGITYLLYFYSANIYKSQLWNSVLLMYSNAATCIAVDLLDRFQSCGL
jgi:hypothetical protein